MNFHVVTLFPEAVEAYTNASILGRAQKEKLLKVKTYQLRDFAGNPVKAKANGAGKWQYMQVDDKPYGGGTCMVLKADIVGHAIDAAMEKLPGAQLVITTPRGTTRRRSTGTSNASTRYRASAAEGTITVRPQVMTREAGCAR